VRGRGHCGRGLNGNNFREFGDGLRVNAALFISALALFCAAAAFFLDLRRRRLPLRQFFQAPLLKIFDLLALAALAGFVVLATSGQWPLRGGVYVALPAAAVAGIGLFFYLWGEGRRAHQFQRPDGIVLGQGLVLAGFARSALRFLGKEPPAIDAWSFAGIAAGGLLLAIVVPRFLKGKEEHRILDRIVQHGVSAQPEYTPPTPECPHPERWTMMDSMSAEAEVLAFLDQLVRTLKPALILETGTFLGLSAIRMAQGLQANGFGRLITCEYDPVVYAKAREQIAASAVAAHIESRNESSLEMRVEGTIDLFFSDSHLPIREQEIRRFLPQISPNGLILMHDSSSHYEVARAAAFRLEQEGLISMVLLPTPRGLMIAQKRAGRR